jgi:hypothetical protein
MIDLHIQEVLEEVRDAITAHLEEADLIEDAEERFSAAEEVMQEILDKISPLIERDI